MENHWFFRTRTNLKPGDKCARIIEGKCTVNGQDYFKLQLWKGAYMVAGGGEYGLLHQDFVLRRDAQFRQMIEDLEYDDYLKYERELHGSVDKQWADSLVKPLG